MSRTSTRRGWPARGCTPGRPREWPAPSPLLPVGHWAELGARRLVTEPARPDPVVVPLLADPVLVETTEVFLDAAGSASPAASALRIHRQTLYYRLSRIGAVTGLGLSDGEARLLLHASLRAARPDPPAYPTPQER
jgi:hypothetical protein